MENQAPSSSSSTGARATTGEAAATAAAGEPTPQEYIDAIKKVEEECGELLEGLELFSVVSEYQAEGQDAQPPTYDALDPDGIVAISLGPGTVTLNLRDPEDNTVEIQEVVRPGMIYVLVNRSVKYLKQEITAPVGGDRYAIVGRYITEEKMARMRSGRE